MSFALFSQETKILDTLRDLDVSIRFFSRLQTEISPSKVLEGLSGQSRLTTEQLAPLVKIAEELRRLADEHCPILIAWKNPELYRSVLQRRWEERGE